MTKGKKLSGLLLATSAAALFAAAPVASAAEGGEAKVHCSGVNSCKGTSDCATSSSACKGQNACKGQGWKSMTKEECETAGGEVAE